MKRCDNCGAPCEKPYVVKLAGRVAHVCGDCLETIASGIARIDRAFRRAA